MKYVVVLGDGMADEPLEILGNKTPLDVAEKTFIDELAKQGEVGLCDTIPKGMKPGSDTANLSVIGYDPKKYYTGRSPLEAVSIGIDMLETDVCYRCNVVTVSEDEEAYEDKLVIDHSADEITSEEAAELIETIQEAFGDDIKQFYSGVSYRHALIWHHGSVDVNLTPPHDILEKRIGDYLPRGDYGEDILDMMKRSYDILKDHPVNVARRKKGLRPANSIWIWGEGKKPILPDFYKTFGRKGSMISAVDLLKGIAIAAGMESIDVDGATGNIHTNYKGKVDACLEALKRGQDFVYVHIEAPDECGHQGDVEAKVLSIKQLNDEVVKPIVEGLTKMGEDFRLLLMPDHPTPIKYRTHTNTPVPYMIYDSANQVASGLTYSESDGKASGKFEPVGHLLMPRFLQCYL